MLGVFYKFSFYAKTFDLGSIKEYDSCVLWWGREKRMRIYNEGSVFSVITPKVIKQRWNFNELSCVRRFSIVWWSWATEEVILICQGLLKTSAFRLRSKCVLRVEHKWLNERLRHFGRDSCANQTMTVVTALPCLSLSSSSWETRQKLPWNQHLLLHLYFSGYKTVVISVRSP